MRRLLPAAAPAAAAVAVLALSGCVPFACPTIGYGSSVTVTVVDLTVVELDCAVGCEGGIDDPYAAGPTWRFDAPGRPASVTVVGRDVDGLEILREEVVLAWTVADPGNRCGSSASAEPVTLGG